MGIGIANYKASVGEAVLSISRSWFEVSSKIGVYMAYKAFCIVRVEVDAVIGSFPKMSNDEFDGGFMSSVDAVSKSGTLVDCIKKFR